jgi:hypothetical protein
MSDGNGGSSRVPNSSTRHKWERLSGLGLTFIALVPVLRTLATRWGSDYLPVVDSAVNRPAGARVLARSTPLDPVDEALRSSRPLDVAALDRLEYLDTVADRRGGVSMCGHRLRAVGRSGLSQDYSRSRS